jgi:transposase
VTSILCGVDVACDHLDARLRPDTAPGRRFANTAEGVTELTAFCREQGVELVVMEATGGYERLGFALLWAAGIPAAIVNPRQVRRFAEAMGLLEKTDRIDAGVIAWYAEARRIVARPPAGATQRQLAALLTRLRQLVELRVAQANQRRLVDEPLVLASIDELLALVIRQVRTLEARIVALIADDALWRALDAAFRSIKGVAGRTVAHLLALLPEIGTLTGKAAAKLVGLAPLAHDSGKLQGRRSVRGGRSGVRAILFTVAEVVRRHDPDFAAVHKRLIAAGKPKKLVRVALARKLLVRLNAKARNTRRQLAHPAAA